MVVNEKALVREMKEAFKGWGYTVIVRPGDEWVISSRFWVVQISGMKNVPREVLSLLALHMGFLPETGNAYRVYKSGDDAVVQNEVFAVALEPIEKLEEAQAQSSDAPLWIQRTKLLFDKTRVWQQERNLKILLIDPRFENIIAGKTEVRTVGDAIYAEGEISDVYVMRVRNDTDKSQLDHLAQMQWIAT